MNLTSYDWLEEKIYGYLARPDEIRIEEFKYHLNDENNVAFILKRMNGFREMYQNLVADNEDGHNDSEIFNTATRAAMLFAGLVLFEYEEDK